MKINNRLVFEEKNYKETIKKLTRELQRITKKLLRTPQKNYYNTIVKNLVHYCGVIIILSENY